GPGAGPVGCKEILRPYLPQSHMGEWDSRRPDSVGQVRAFFGNFLVVARALTYALTLGKEGITRTSGMAVLNANYLMRKIEPYFPPYYNRICMHEFVISLEKVKKQSGVGALDVAKCLLDYGMHPPTMYFPLNVPEALMVEPTETENRETLDEAAQAFAEIFEAIKNDPDCLHDCPKTTYISRPDEVGAARNPIVRYQFD
ncbi:MAG: aminomethyl-transferring glycine dehydrogenase subunit GcvPB, partial [Clostridiales bacterium]|nr:aminomethyl-transferring glycine dehydrogenase subunit GcvPB [Clostridiales bacterium]